MGTSPVITMRTDTSRVTFTQIEKILQTNTELIALPSKKAMAGTWSFSHFSNTGTDATFTPNSLLASGEYLIQFTKKGRELDARHLKSSFHVGPLPRVRFIRAASNKKVQGKPIPWNVLFVEFSEKVAESKVKATVEVKNKANAFSKLGISLSGSTTGGVGTSSMIVLSTPLDVSVPLRVTIKPDVGALSGLKLDGKYTGQAGSGKFEVIFTPKDHGGTDQKAFKWKPAFSY